MWFENRTDYQFQIGRVGSRCAVATNENTSEVSSCSSRRRRVDGRSLACRWGFCATRQAARWATLAAALLVNKTRFKSSIESLVVVVQTPCLHRTKLAPMPPPPCRPSVSAPSPQAHAPPACAAHCSLFNSRAADSVVRRVLPLVFWAMCAALHLAVICLYVVANYRHSLGTANGVKCARPLPLATSATTCLANNVERVQVLAAAASHVHRRHLRRLYRPRRRCVLPLRLCLRLRRRHFPQRFQGQGQQPFIGARLS